MVDKVLIGRLPQVRNMHGVRDQSKRQQQRTQGLDTLRACAVAGLGKNGIEITSDNMAAVLGREQTGQQHGYFIPNHTPMFLPFTR